MPDRHGTDPPGEATRRFYEALDRRDAAVLFSLVHPEMVWDTSRWGLGRHVGVAQIARFMQDWMGNDARYRIDLTGVLEFGGGVVMVELVHHLPQDRAGALPVQTASVLVWREGLAVRLISFRDLKEALAAARELAGEEAPGARVGGGAARS